jgi:Family of unknown function (DUF5677)
VSKRPKKKSRRQTRTPISRHQKKGKVLQPPFVQFGLGKGLVSWMNDRLPEMIWAALLISALGREAALKELRAFLRFVWDNPDRESLYDCTLTGFANLEDSLRSKVIGFLCRSDLANQALSPLLLFEGLPARVIWQENLQVETPDSSAPMVLMEAVRLTLFHQSQEATDCRWVRLMCGVFGRRVIIPVEELKLLNGYPHLGDQTAVRPSIRAIEGAMNMGEEQNLTWPKAFWSECWKKTPCMALAPNEKPSSAPGADTISFRPLSEIRGELEAHWEKTHSTTGIDAKHDAVFGMAFFAIRLAEETFSADNSCGILGRLALRTLLEIHVTLRHLLTEDKLELWRSWRTYGAGQAKLVSLKLEELPDTPHYIDVDLLRNIANEDFWEEFVSVDLGHWAGVDLRKLSENVDLKDIYDRYYGWTSGFSHAHWGSIRESVFSTCLNPLHRGHRYPRTGKPVPLQSVQDDIRDLLNAILSDLDRAYPAFKPRLA